MTSPSDDDPRAARTRLARHNANERMRAAAAARQLATRTTIPEPGFWLTTRVKGGPLVPACIRWVETTAEPGNPGNDMAGTRSPHLAAFILYEAVEVHRLWSARLQPITAAQYAEWIQKWEDELIVNPKKLVDLTRLPPVRPPGSV